MSLILIIDKINPDGGMDVFKRLPADYIEKLKQNIPQHLYKLLADVVTVLLKRINVPDDEIEKVAEQLYKRRINEMFPFFENYDVQETRRIAKAEGRAEERIIWQSVVTGKDEEIDQLRLQIAELMKKPENHNNQ